MSEGIAWRLVRTLGGVAAVTLLVLVVLLVLEVPDMIVMATPIVVALAGSAFVIRLLTLRP